MTELTLLKACLVPNILPFTIPAGEKKYGFHGSCKQGKKRKTRHL